MEKGRNSPHSLLVFSPHFFRVRFSLRSRRLEVVGERENGRARERHAKGPLACILIYFIELIGLICSKHLLRWLRTI